MDDEGGARAVTLHMRWEDLLFAHWPLDPDVLRPLIPPDLEIETFDGRAWLGIVPFVMRGVRIAPLPGIPTTTDFPELNVRTYVVARGVPAVWFLSLDAASTLAVIGARIGVHLPYFRARFRIRREGDAVVYASRRRHPAAPASRFLARYAPLDPAATPATPAPGTLAAFLTDRRYLVSAAGEHRWLLEVEHVPWRLREGRADVLEADDAAAAHGLTLPPDPPVLYRAEDLDVRALVPRRLA